MSERSDIDLLDDIVICISRMISYVEGVDYESFIRDHKTQDAVVRNIEVIGEAVKLLSVALKAEHPTIPWRVIAGTRDRLIHGYFGVNLDIVWGIATVDIPNLKDELEGIRTRLGGV